MFHIIKLKQVCQCTYLLYLLKKKNKYGNDKGLNKKVK